MSEKIIIYDRTDRSIASSFWRPGVTLYKALGKCTQGWGVTSVMQAWERLGAMNKSIDQIEFWCHGRQAGFIIGSDWFNLQEARFGSHQRLMLESIGKKMTKDGVLWIRACSCFAGPSGRQFAEQFSLVLNRKVAGHTHVIGAWQSGLHVLSPGECPYWDVSEGKTDRGHGTALSRPWIPNTVSALCNRVD